MAATETSPHTHMYIATEREAQCVFNQQMEQARTLVPFVKRAKTSIRAEFKISFKY